MKLKIVTKLATHEMLHRAKKTLLVYTYSYNNGTTAPKQGIYKQGNVQT